MSLPSNAIRPRKGALLFLLLISLCYVAFADYRSVGSDGFSAGTTYWGSASPVTDAVGVDYVRFVPLVADLDGDGTSELIFMSGSYVYVADADTLDLLDAAVVTGSTWFNYTQPYVVDADADGKLEVLVAYTARNTSSPSSGDPQDGFNISVQEFGWNGTAIIREESASCWEQSAADTGSSFVTDIRGAFSCVGTDCFLYTRALGESSVIGTNYVSHYEDGSCDPSWKLSDNSGTTGLKVLPSILTVPADDIDSDGQEEFLVPVLNVKAQAWSGDESLLVYVFQINGSGTGYDLERTSTQGLGGLIAGSLASNLDIYYDDASADGRHLFGDWVSSVAVGDFDGLPSNGHEYVVSVRTSTTPSYKMYSFRGQTGALLDDYPEVGSVDGLATSNVVPSQFFGDTDAGDDFCTYIYGYNVGEDTLLCASEATSSISESYESQYILSGDETINATAYTRRFDMPITLVTSLQAKANVWELPSGHTVDPYEYLTPYGILDVTPAFLLERNRSFSSGVATYVLSAHDGEAFEDIYAAKTTSLWFFDDGFRNHDCLNDGCISSIYFDPCPDEPWLQNTSVLVLVDVDDNEEDAVSANVSLYYGLPYQKNSSSPSLTVPATATHTFVANETASTATWRVVAADAANPTLKQARIGTFAVSASSGVVKGDVSCTIAVAGPSATNATTATLTTSAENNHIKQLTTVWSAFSGIAGAALWYIIMLIIAMVGWTKAPTGTSGGQRLGLIIIVEILMLVIGVYAGVIGVVSIIIVLIAAVAAISFALTRHSQGGM